VLPISNEVFVLVPAQEPYLQLRREEFDVSECSAGPNRPCYFVSICNPS
jgi:hypothetical protein